jgi:hypothetical protein
MKDVPFKETLPNFYTKMCLLSEQCKPPRVYTKPEKAPVLPPKPILRSSSTVNLDKKPLPVKHNEPLRFQNNLKGRKIVSFTYSLLFGMHVN